MVVLVVVEALVIALLAVLVAGLLRSHADILRALHDLGAGEHGLVGQRSTGPTPVEGPIEVRDDVVPPAAGATPAAGDVVGAPPGGGQRKVAVVGTDHPTLLAFLSSGCGTCAEFWSAFGDSGGLDLPSPTTRLVVVTKGAEAESPAKVAELAPDGVTTLMSSEAWADYRVPGSPYFVLVDGPSGSIVGEGSGTSWTQVSTLLRSALADAGLALGGGARVVRRADGDAREARADDELRAAGILPGDESLYPTDLPQVEDPEGARG